MTIICDYTLRQQSLDPQLQWRDMEKSWPREQQQPPRTIPDVIGPASRYPPGSPYWKLSRVRGQPGALAHRSPTVELPSSTTPLMRGGNRAEGQF